MILLTNYNKQQQNWKTSDKVNLITSYLKLCYRPGLLWTHWEWYPLKISVFPLEDSTTDSVSIRFGNALTIVIITFFIVVFANTVACCFCIILVTIDVVYVNSLRFKHTDSLCHFLEINYRGLNLNFLRLKKLFIDGDIELNLVPTQNNLNPQLGFQRKINFLKEHQKSVILVKTMLMLLVIQRHKFFFLIQFIQSVWKL